MHISDFDFELPDDLIAQHPLGRRDASRMLVVSRAGRRWRDGSFAEFAGELRPGDTVVVNNTRVFPARLVGRREPTGGRVELLLARRREDLGGETWEALARPARRLDAGARVTFGGGRLGAEVLSSTDDGARRVVRFEAEGDFAALLEELGRMPLPPYIKRDGRDLASRDEDRERYQTVYAAASGAIAAPTAGLHFTPELLARIDERGAARAEVVLHVGAGTFKPVEVDDPAEHRMHEEWYTVPADAAERINVARRGGGRIWAVGTTTLRTLESALREDGAVASGDGETRIFIRPPARVRSADVLVTNFHLPRSTLLMLVASFAGYELTMRAYETAIAERYRFYSYGDAMVIL
jgi:S-adenosylmethionine:tRNA ribosyltransferase-isomerase